MNTACTQTYGQLNNSGKRNVHLYSFLQKKGYLVLEIYNTPEHSSTKRSKHI